MIIDQIKNVSTYEGLSDNFKKAFDFLASQDLKSMEVGKYEIDGENVFVLIQEYEPKEESEGKCEAHKEYADIQFIISGIEKMGYAPVEEMEIIDPYNEAKDRYFVKWRGTFNTYTEGMFAVFFPQDAHMPGIKVEQSSKVKKAVVKVKM